MKNLLKWMTKTRGRAVLLLCLGLAAALIVASTALSGAAEAKQGVPNLKKGVTNLVETTTTLVGFVAEDPVLKLDNNSTTENATALDLQVEPGNAPLTVNEETGTATNLDADKVDGKDSTELVGQQDPKGDKGDPEPQGPPGSGGDADTLDGQDSAAFFSGKTYVNEVSKDGPGSSGTVLLFAGCDSEDSVLSAGGGSLDNDVREDDLLFSKPSPDAPWAITVQDNGRPDTIQAAAICADFPPLRGQ